MTKVDFHEFMEKIRKRLEKELPGESIHKKMLVTNNEKNAIKPNNFTKYSAVLILLYPSENQIFIPFILRPKYDGFHGGQVAFPGGKREKSDENLIRTALREAQEEIGIRISDVTILGELTEFFIAPSNFFVRPIVAFTNTKPNYYPDEKEVELVFESTINEISSPTIISNEIINTVYGDILAPVYNIQNYKVWGATAMMISEFLTILEESN